MPALGAEVNSRPTFRWLGPPHSSSTSPLGISKLCVTMIAPMNGTRASSPWNRGNWKVRRIWLLGHGKPLLLIHLISSVWMSRLPSESSPHCSTCLVARDSVKNKAKTAKNTTKHFIFLVTKWRRKTIFRVFKISFFFLELFEFFAFLSFLLNWKDRIAFNRASLYDC